MPRLSSLSSRSLTGIGIGIIISTPTPTYTLTPAANNVNEGSALTFNVGGANITNGTYYWTVNRPEDFATSSGSFTITDNVGSFNVTPAADGTTEGIEVFAVQLRTSSISGTIVATSANVTINDTSQVPADIVPTTAMPSPQNLTDWDTVNGSLITYSILNTTEFFVSQGSSWVSRTLPLPYPSNQQSIRYYNGFVYAVVTPGSPTFSRDIYRSTDYQTWNLVFSTGINSRWRIDINETTGRFLATSGGTANAAISSNGSSWTAISLPAAAIDLGFGNKGWNGNTVVAANWGSLTDHLYRSTDNGATWSSVANSTTWSSVAVNSRRYAQSVASNGSRFIALIGQANRRMSISTDDGVTWTTPEVNTQWHELANNIFFSRVKNKFVVTNAGSGQSTVSYSTDGAVGNWSTTSTLPANVTYIVESATRVYGAATNGSVVDLTDLI